MTHRHPASTFLRFALVALLAVSAVGFAGASCEKTPPSKDLAEQPDKGTDSGETKTAPEVKKPTTVGPKTPALMIISGLKGYTEPCGCTLDIMLGGIDRIVRYVDDSKSLYAGFAMVDSGDLLFDRTEIADHEMAQEKARVDLIVESLKRLPIGTTVPGERDFALGVDFYLATIAKTSIQPIGANIELRGNPLQPSAPVKINEDEILIIAAVDPSHYASIEGVATREPDAAIASALKDVAPETTVVFLGQGELGWVKKRLKAHPRIDFGVVGRDPRETDQVDSVGDAHTLEPYDQGRYLGVLKLNRSGADRFTNARTGGKSEMETLDRQIEHVNKSIERLPPASPGQEPPILLNLRKRLSELEDRKQEIRDGSLATPSDKSWFIWSTVPMEPEYLTDPKIEEARLAYNKSLKALATATDRQVEPAKDGEAFFVGTAQCDSCHAPAHKFWSGTEHAEAFATLVKRDKDFDLSCVGCHVVGYEKPGGSIVGKIEYPVSLGSGDDKVEFTKDLRNVGCESCHGPGSTHMTAPVDAKGKAQHILAAPDATACAQCHVPEHSPRFNFESYVKQITGPGHIRVSNNK